MLATLPPELLNMVFGQVTSHQDLKRLCEVCRRFNDIVTPHLYRSLVLSAPELSLKDLVMILGTIPSKNLSYIQEFGFRVPIHEQVESRCVHQSSNNEHLPFIDDDLQDGLAEFLTNDGNMDFEDMDDDDTTEDEDEGRTRCILSDLGRAIRPLMLPDDQLRSFRWEVGTCMPKALFCGDDSFLRNQRKIQSITFITDGECSTNNTAQSSVDLVQFRDLRSLDWRGLNQYTDFESVRECIEVHGHQIHSLTLDFLTWVRAETIWSSGFRRQDFRRKIPDNFFSERVLNIHPQDQKVIFLSLENLHLSAVSFNYAAREMVHAFNIKHLKSLKLRDCPGTLHWLQVILDSRKPMELKSLELALDLCSFEREAHMHITETICNFVHHVSDLESLYLMLPEPIDWTSLTDRISTHCHQLKRFVMHHLVDRGGQNLIDGDIPWPLHLEHILQEKQLTCFGSSIPPGILTSHLQRMQPRPSCKLIHVRISGVVLDKLSSEEPSWFSSYVYTSKYGDDLPYKPDEIHNFAQWAFSADGLPNLQVLACGDFSYGGRYSKFNRLLCKSDGGYKALTPSNTMSWELVLANMDMLAACPLDNILE